MTNTIKHEPRDAIRDDPLMDVRAPLKKALELTDEDFDNMSPQVKNLLSARRKIGVTWLDDYEVVVEVVRNEGCTCGVEVGQRVVFDMRHRIKPEKTDATLCMHLLAPVLVVFYMSFDRASEGLNPLSRIWTCYDCLNTGDDEGLAKARTRVFLRRADTHAEVTEPVLMVSEGEPA